MAVIVGLLRAGWDRQREREQQGCERLGTCHGGLLHFTVMTTSRYSIGTTSDAAPAVLNSSSNATMSRSSRCCPAASSAAKALCVGPYQSRNTCTQWAASR